MRKAWESLSRNGCSGFVEIVGLEVLGSLALHDLHDHGIGLDNSLALAWKLEQIRNDVVVLLVEWQTASVEIQARWVEWDEEGVYGSRVDGEIKLRLVHDGWGIEGRLSTGGQFVINYSVGSLTPLALILPFNVVLTVYLADRQSTALDRSSRSWIRTTCFRSCRRSRATSRYMCS